jgi:hypothetical protein
MSGNITLENGTRKPYKRFTAMLNLIYAIDSIASMNTGLIDLVKAEAINFRTNAQVEIIVSDIEEVAATIETVEDIPTYTEVNINEVECTQEDTQETTYTVYNRTFTTYTQAFQYCLESDFDPELMIEEVGSIPASIIQSNHLQMDLQYFSQPTIEVNQTLIFNNYDSMVLSNKEWEKDIDKHSSKYMELREKEVISQSDIHELINNKYSFWVKLINANCFHPYTNHCLIDITLKYINKSFSCFISKDEYNNISQSTHI